MAPISPVAVPDLPPEVQKVLDEFVFAARQAFSEQLTSIVLFGSAAEGKLRPASDVNLLIILSAFEQGRADHLRQPLRIAESAVQLRPMFLLREEVAVASRVFAPKFADISRRSVILYGEDPFAELSIPRDAEIRQLRQQCLNLTLRLRAAYVGRSLREEQLTRFISGTLGPLRALSAALLELESRPGMPPQAAFECLGEELKLSQWPETLALLAAAHENRLLTAGSAAQVLFQLLEFLRGATLRVEALSSEVRRESV
jgi:predicted nucleotidyltransferase